MGRRGGDERADFLQCGFPEGSAPEAALDVSGEAGEQVQEPGMRLLRQPKGREAGREDLNGLERSQLFGGVKTRRSVAPASYAHRVGTS
jgi:hypothetical protein